MSYTITFIVVSTRKLLYITTLPQEDHSHIKSLVKGKPFLRKSLKTPLTLASLMSFLKKKKSQAQP
jgi:hypothetical protein